MTIQAKLADGRVLEFPDGTDQAVIQSAIKDLLAREKQEQDLQTQQEILQPLQEFVGDIRGIGEAAATIWDFSTIRSPSRHCRWIGSIDPRPRSGRDKS